MQAYELRGDLDRVLLQPKSFVNRISKEFFATFNPEVESAIEQIRSVPASLPSWWIFESLPLSNKRTKLRFSDFVSSSCGYPGTELFVSERAVDLLNPFLSKECAFLPVQIDGAPTRYFYPWVLTTTDAIDRSKSEFKDDVYLDWSGQRRSRLMTFEFREEKVDGRLLVRLPGAHLSLVSQVTYCTSAFIELVRKLKISGVHCLRSAQDPQPLVPFGKL
jgi:hypothetical protein